MILVVESAQALDQCLEDDGLAPPEPAILQVEIVDEFPEVGQGCIDEAEADAQDFKGAPVPVVREVALERVEGDVTRRARRLGCLLYTSDAADE